MRPRIFLLNATFFLVALLASEAGEAASSPGETPLQAIAAGSLSDIMGAIKTRGDTLPVPTIRSDKGINQLKGADRTPAEKSRAFGDLLFGRILSVPIGNANDPIAQASDLLVLRQWLLTRPAYGNLALAYLAQDRARELLFAALVNGVKGEAIQNVIEELSGKAPNYGDWSTMLRLEGVGEKATEEGPYTSDEVTLFKLLNRLADPRTGLDEGTDLPRRTLQSCYETRNIAQLSWNAMTRAMCDLALRVCMRLAKSPGGVPFEEGRFEEAVQRYAGDLVDRNRDGVRMSSDRVWGFWTRAKKLYGAGGEQPYKPVTVAVGKRSDGSSSKVADASDDGGYRERLINVRASPQAGFSSKAFERLVLVAGPSTYRMDWYAGSVHNAPVLMPGRQYDFVLVARPDSAFGKLCFRISIASRLGNGL